MGCATSVSKFGANVHVIFEPEFIRKRENGCRYIKRIEAYSGWGGLAATGTGRRSAYAKLKNEAGRLGGNIVFVGQSIVFQKKILGLADSELAQVTISVEETPKYLS